MSEPGTIYYTLNGSTPSLTSTPYSGPVTISSTETLKYLAVDLAGNQSPVYTQIYTIDKIPPKVLTTTPTNKKTMSQERLQLLLNSVKTSNPVHTIRI